MTTFPADSRSLIGLSFVLSLLLAHSSMAGEPVVRPLVPGITARALPVQLSNVNNLAFAPDGRLFALGYDGRVHRLVDRTGDGIEDHAEPVWEEPTIRVPIGLAWAPEGLYISSQGKVSLLIDDDADGRADREEIVASGWPPTDVRSGGVDALGVTLGPDGRIYFGLGTADYSNPYRIEEGEARYDLGSERGTILRHSHDSSRREIVATGIRFPYALRFNRHGDLFATDQEGETWLPGGNPLDEVNHIVPGRHYGFPPRHPEHLPEVVDEPPTVAFSPQHQSTCGMIFNEARDGWSAFGPAFWEGDAFVAGFSRGKLWRVRLVKTPHGYVGRPTLIASSDLMVADVALSPSGDLYLTCHSGPPDWGSGPQGEGRIYKLTFGERDAPQPVTSWAAGPLEARVAFDRPIDPAILDTLPGLEIPFGMYVRAADRFEAHKPPYKTVEAQEAIPRGTLRIAEARLLDDGRTLALSTDPHPWAVSYAITLPGVAAPDRPGPPTILDLDYDLTGVSASWRGDDGDSWNGWWPHTDPAVVTALTAGSSEHERQLALLDRPGTLTLRAQIRPSTDHSIYRIDASDGPAKVLLDGQTGARTDPDRMRPAEVSFPPGGDWQSLTIEATTGKGSGPFVLRSSFVIGPECARRPVPIEQLRLPWAAEPPNPSSAPEADPDPRWAAGDPTRGEALFHSEQARCASCHLVRSQGGDLGPDLSNLVHRDADSVYRDIVEPSATIHPDYVASILALTDGRVLAGLVRAEGRGRLRITDDEAEAAIIPLDLVEEYRPSPTSIMPEGLLEPFDEDDIRDLLAFLTTEPEPGEPDGPPADDVPPARSIDDLKAILGPPPEAPDDAPPLTVLLIAGPKDHGPGEHDYPAWQASWHAWLDDAPGLTVLTADPWPEPDQWRVADLVLCYFWNHDWSDARLADIDAFLGRGGGLIALHAAVIADEEPAALADRLGLAAQPGRTDYRHGPIDLRITAPPDHPITRGLTAPPFLDETYWPLIGDRSRVSILATAVEDDEPQPLLWTFEPGEARVIGSILGHYSWTLDDPIFRLLILRSMAWASRSPVARFERLILDDGV